MLGDSGENVRDDGVYVVSVYLVEDRLRGQKRTRWRCDGFYKGHRASTVTRSTFSLRDAALACAEALWADYVAGLHRAPDTAPKTVGELIDRFVAQTTAKKGRLLSEKTGRAK